MDAKKSFGISPGSPSDAEIRPGFIHTRQIFDLSGVAAGKAGSFFNVTIADKRR